MKKILYFLAFFSISLFGCKKDKATCETSVAGIAANYKVTKVELVSSTGTTDVTGTYLDDCRKNALYQLKADGTLVYTEEGSTCTDSGAGVWAVVTGKITTSGTPFNFDNGTIDSWNCTTLIVSSDFVSGTTLRYSFVKQ